MAFTNQRRFPRAKIALEVDWGRTPSCGYSGQVTSLSVGGCFTQTQREAEIPSRSVLFMRLLLAPEAVSILDGLMMGRVAYNLEALGFGVEFMTLKSGYEEEVRDLVNFYLEDQKEDTLPSNSNAIDP
jgi:hypothetical protein